MNWKISLKYFYVTDAVLPGTGAFITFLNDGIFVRSIPITVMFSKAHYERNNLRSNPL